ncbi:MAG: hypothetical protein LBN37_05970 [Bacteroidales bacterium]|jgi:hypothetical protein|nr:hypothetical protein [Bacteroidales bacterium]
MAVGMVFLFILGLPLSFGIGALIGYMIWLKNKNQLKKAKYYVLRGGFLYIISQPFSISVCFLPLRKLDKLLGFSIPLEGISLCEMIFAILFAVFFTVIILLLLVKHNKKSA